MYVQETGNPDAPELVFLHGGGLTSWMWRQQVEDLKDYHCLVPDLPGHGESSQETWVSFADTAGRVADIIRQKSAVGRAHVVGLSLGGYIVVSLLSQAPEVVDHAVVSGINALPYAGEGLIKAISRMTLPLLKWKPMVKASLRAMHLSEEDQVQYIKSLEKLDPQAYLRLSDQAIEFRLPPISPDLTAPVLIVVGEKEVKNALQSQPVLVNGIPGAVGRIAPGVGHAWVGENPSLFSRMVRCWIEDRPLPEELLEI
jgi:pimeloyl-ACP methyl ester carboxylesterase